LFFLFSFVEQPFSFFPLASHVEKRKGKSQKIGFTPQFPSLLNASIISLLLDAFFALARFLSMGGYWTGLDWIGPDRSIPISSGELFFSFRLFP